MGTAGIFRAILFHIQSESSPIYRQEIAQTPPSNATNFRMGSWLSRGVLILLTVLVLFGSSGFLSVTSDIAILVILLLVALIISLTWIVPLAVLSGQGIAHERNLQTWSILLMTPLPTEDILLAKGAASIRKVVNVTLAFGLFTALFSSILLGISMTISSGGAHSNAFVIVILTFIGVIAIFIEHQQEISLSFVVGQTAALLPGHPRFVSLIGLGGGALIRLATVFVVLAFVSPGGGVLSSSLSSSILVGLSIVGGSASALVASPTFWGILFVIGMIALREGLIRVLFAWNVRRCRNL